MSTLIRNAAVFRNNSIVENQNIVIDGKYIKEFPDMMKLSKEIICFAFLVLSIHILMWQ